MSSTQDSMKIISPVCVKDVRAVLDYAYPPQLAESWDRVGLIVGDPEAVVESVMCALDCTDTVVNEAIAREASMIVVHHPLLLRGITSAAADTAKGRIIHTLIQHNIALFAAHTNADSARPGVNDALASVLGVTSGPALKGVPEGQNSTGIGRVGTLETPMTLEAFTQHVAQKLPKSIAGVKAAGDPQKLIRTVAVASGAGDSFLDQVASMDVDCFVTSDLRHHPVDEFLRVSQCAIIDTAHWASEFPWCYQAARVIEHALSLDVSVLETPTEPWTLHSLT